MNIRRNRTIIRESFFNNVSDSDIQNSEESLTSENMDNCFLFIHIQNADSPIKISEETFIHRIENALDNINCVSGYSVKVNLKGNYEFEYDNVTIGIPKDKLQLKAINDVLDIVCLIRQIYQKRSKIYLSYYYDFNGDGLDYNLFDGPNDNTGKIDKKCISNIIGIRSLIKGVESETADTYEAFNQFCHIVEYLLMITHPLETGYLVRNFFRYYDNSNKDVVDKLSSNIEDKWGTYKTVYYGRYRNGNTPSVYHSFDKICFNGQNISMETIKNMFSVLSGDDKVYIHVIYDKKCINKKYDDYMSGQFFVMDNRIAFSYSDEYKDVIPDVADNLKNIADDPKIQRMRQKTYVIRNFQTDYVSFSIWLGIYQKGLVYYHVVLSVFAPESHMTKLMNALCRTDFSEDEIEWKI